MFQNNEGGNKLFLFLMICLILPSSVMLKKGAAVVYSRLPHIKQ